MNSRQVREQLEDARRDRERLFGEAENLRARQQVDGETAGMEERLGNINRGIERADGRIQELEAEFGRMAYLEELAQNPANLEGEQRDERRDVRPGPRNEVRDTALRVVERHSDVMEAGAADNVDRLVRTDRSGDWVSRYVAAVGSEHYRAAFGKIVQDPAHGHLTFTPEEVEAVREARAIEYERTALAIGGGPTGGFLLPFTLDPTVMLSSAGALNPIRRISRVVTTSTNEWRGVSSDGVTVAYSAEGAGMADNSPTFAQPNIVCQRWSAFVPYSWELGMDWQGLESELARLVADGRDVNDSSVFFTGTSASNQPNGVLSASGLTASQQVISVGSGLFAVGDVWALKESVPARFMSQTTFAFNPAVLDKTYRMVGSGATAEGVLMQSREGNLVGRPVVEWSALGGTIAASATVSVAGDWASGYVIADRLGLSAVTIPALFAGTASSHWPTGQAGLVVWGRTGANVVNANALRVLTVR